MPSMRSIFVSRANTDTASVFVGDSGEGGPFEEGFFLLLSDFLNAKDEVEGAMGKNEASRSGRGGGGVRREGCSASIASARKALLERLFSLESIEDFTFRS